MQLKEKSNDKFIKLSDQIFRPNELSKSESVSVRLLEILKNVLFGPSFDIII